MSIAGYQVRFQKGITGGFAPPTPSAIHTLSVNDDGTTLTIVSQTRPHGTPTLGDPVTRTLSVGSDNTADLLAELRTILSEIPPQYPGAEDLYRKDISIITHQNSTGFAAYGSAAAHGVQPPTEEQVGRFNRAVEIVNQLVARA
ncbi:hypothetical protein V8B97DRAFT_2016017 [Scleroderma yunnanense]